jgi:hypothetical protein
MSRLVTLRLPSDASRRLTASPVREDAGHIDAIAYVAMTGDVPRMIGRRIVHRTRSGELGTAVPGLRSGRRV